jgi:hypothetical protein
VSDRERTTTTRHPFLLTNHVANPVLRPLLKSRVGKTIGKRLAVIRYRGRRTGREHELVVQYARENDHVWVMPGRPELKTWWRNLRRPAGVTVWLAGRRYDGSAVAIDGRENPIEGSDAARRYLAELPQARKALHLGETTDPAAIAPSIVIVRIDLLGT